MRFEHEFIHEFITEVIIFFKIYSKLNIINNTPVSFN